MRNASPQAAPAAVFLHVSELRPNPRNPRTHGDEVTRLARTILRTAWGAPIVAQKRSRRIIGGHGRLEAAQAILAGLVVDGEPRGGAEHRFDPDAPGPGMVPVRLVDVSDAEADAMTVADNARALQGTDDAVRLLEMLSSFGRGTDLLADVGFDDASLDALVKGAGDDVLASSESSPSHDGQPPHDGQPATDPATEWEGMPGFDNENNVHRKIVVNFETAEDVADFFRRIEQTDTGKLRSIWHPFKPKRDLESLRWETDGSDVPDLPPDEGAR